MNQNIIKQEKFFTWLDATRARKSKQLALVFMMPELNKLSHKTSKKTFSFYLQPTKGRFKRFAVYDGQISNKMSSKERWPRGNSKYHSMPISFTIIILLMSDSSSWWNESRLTPTGVEKFVPEPWQWRFPTKPNKLWSAMSHAVCYSVCLLSNVFMSESSFSLHLSPN